MDKILLYWLMYDISGILNSKVQNDNGSIFKSAVIQGASKALG